MASGNDAENVLIAIPMQTEDKALNYHSNIASQHPEEDQNSDVNMVVLNDRELIKHL